MQDTIDTERTEEGEYLPMGTMVLHKGGTSSVGLLKKVEGLAAKASILTKDNMDQLERLFAMQQTLRKQDAEQAFNEALAAAQAEIQAVTTNRTNTHTKSKYADLSAIHRVAKPVWTRHGLSVLTKTKPSATPDCICVWGELRHSAGHAEPFEYDWPLDGAGIKGGTNKTGIQSVGSTITYARRYTECMLFDISVDGEDQDGNSPGRAQNGASDSQLTDRAADWIAKIHECESKRNVDEVYQEAFDDLGDRDGYGRNQLNKARNTRKQLIDRAAGGA